MTFRSLKLTIGLVALMLVCASVASAGLLVDNFNRPSGGADGTNWGDQMLAQRFSGTAAANPGSWVSSNLFGLGWNSFQGMPFQMQIDIADDTGDVLTVTLAMYRDITSTFTGVPLVYIYSDLYNSTFNQYEPGTEIAALTTAVTPLPTALNTAANVVGGVDFTTTQAFAPVAGANYWVVLGSQQDTTATEYPFPGDELMWSYQATPEPGTLLTMAFGGLMLFAMRRLRKA